jgi:hypothetical protein
MTTTTTTTTMMMMMMMMMMLRQSHHRTPYFELPLVTFATLRYLQDLGTNVE